MLVNLLGGLALDATLTDGTQVTQVTSLPTDTFTKKTVTVSASGNTAIHTPAAGKKVRLYYFGYSAGAGVLGCLVSLRFGSNPVFDNEYLVAAGQPYARNIQAGRRYIDGGVNEALTVTLSAAQTVYVNVELEEI